MALFAEAYKGALSDPEAVATMLEAVVNAAKELDNCPRDKKTPAFVMSRIDSEAIRLSKVDYISQVQRNHIKSLAALTKRLFYRSSPTARD